MIGYNYIVKAVDEKVYINTSCRAGYHFLLLIVNNFRYTRIRGIIIDTITIEEGWFMKKVVYVVVVIFTAFDITVWVIVSVCFD